MADNTPLVLIIRDGWGKAPPDCAAAPDATNGVLHANTPVADSLMETALTTTVKTSGKSVGLPDGIMGNSEVGHQNIGAGRIVPQELMRLSMAAETGLFATNEVIQEVFHRGQDGRTAHIVGLVSDGCIHSDIAHLFALIDAIPAGVQVCIHIITDGRDTSPTSGLAFVTALEKRIQNTNVRIASVMGRFYAMDRDHRWERVALAYEAMTGNQTSHPDTGENTIQTATRATSAIESYYENPSTPSQVGDEFITPTVIVGDDGMPIGQVSSGDSLFFFNYRGDRPRELTRAFILNDEEWITVPRTPFTRGNQLQDIYFATMTNYERGLNVHGIAFDKPDPMSNILGEILESHGISQLRCAETEKFPHVTFFFNDYREEPFQGEERELVPSPTDVSTYDLKPEMSAPKVTEKVVEALEDENGPQVIVVNFANGDMVGHTGNFNAVVKSIEVVDEGCGRILEALNKKDGIAIVTADHGNAERTFNVETQSPDTAHTTYDVLLHIVGIDQNAYAIRDEGILADIAPTMLEILGIEQPEAMTGQSLLTSIS
ncbi:MAG: 2,3-bisphosphoglycerate-independent phosphoglycerate mutase [Planctomycetota bacterium]|nr:2,3-bisphosphoglycerate-independent phosphoglycerate mutase [Planctomycetota bacterium]